MPDRILHAALADAPLRLLAGVTTATAAEACRRHQPSPAASIALGGAITGALLLGLMQKEERVTAQIPCRGPIRGIAAVADPDGAARGYVAEPGAAAPLRDGRPDMAGLIGPGSL